MKKTTFTIRKWLVRGLVVVGAMIGVTACQHTKKYNLDNDESISSSKSSEVSDVSEVSDISDISVVEDVYGPPVEEIDDMRSVETVYGPPSYFDDSERVPDIAD
ncbi:MAG: hypothetical protein J5629_02310 [Muribaculaceae bacterium]|nr:hypothetical protein [Muribaculaceae bacterium]